MKFKSGLWPGHTAGMLSRNIFGNFAKLFCFELSVWSILNDSVSSCFPVIVRLGGALLQQCYIFLFWRRRIKQNKLIFGLISFWHVFWGNKQTLLKMMMIVSSASQTWGILCCLCPDSQTCRTDGGDEQTRLKQTRFVLYTESTLTAQSVFVILAEGRSMTVFNSNLYVDTSNIPEVCLQYPGYAYIIYFM